MTTHLVQDAKSPGTFQQDYPAFEPVAPKKEARLDSGRTAGVIAKSVVTSGVAVEKGLLKIDEVFKIDANPAKHFTEIKEVGSAILLPFVAGRLVKNITGFTKGDPGENVEQVATICSDFQETGEKVASIAEGLKEIEAVPLSHFKWLKPFSCVLTALSVATLASNVIGIVRMIRLYREMKRGISKGTVDGQITGASFEHLIASIRNKQSKDKKLIKEAFKVKPEQFWEGIKKKETAISELLNSSDEKKIAEGRSMRCLTINMLKGRVRNSIIYTVVSALSTTVAAVAAMILVFSPLCPAGLYLGAGALTMDAGKLLHHKITDYSFAKSLQVKRSKMEWLMA